MSRHDVQPELLPGSVDGASVTAPILSSFGSTPLNHSAVAVSLESRFFFSALITRLLRSSIAVSKDR